MAISVPPEINPAKQSPGMQVEHMSRYSQAALDVAALGLYTGLLIQEQQATGQMLVKARSEPHTTTN